MEVDCTNEGGGGTEICEFLGVESLPTILYGASHDLRTYDDGRTYDELSQFANEHLVPTCSAKNLSLCDSQPKQAMEKFMDMPTSELKVLIAEEEQRMNKILEAYEARVEALQTKFNKVKKERDIAVAAIRDDKAGLKMMISVLGVKTDDPKDEL
jgi:hypothetical protein